MSNYTAPWNLPLAKTSPTRSRLSSNADGYNMFNNNENVLSIASGSGSRLNRAMSSGLLIGEDTLETIVEEPRTTALRPDVAPFFPTTQQATAYDEAKRQTLPVQRESKGGIVLSPYYPPPVNTFLPPETPPMPPTTPAPMQCSISRSSFSTAIAPNPSLADNKDYMSAVYGADDIWATPKKSKKPARDNSEVSLFSHEMLEDDADPYKSPQRRLSTAEYDRLPASKFARSTQSDNDLFGPFGVPTRNLPASTSFPHFLPGDGVGSTASSVSQLVKDRLNAYQQTQINNSNAGDAAGGISLDLDNDFPPLPGPSRNALPAPASHRRKTSAVVSSRDRSASVSSQASTFRGRASAPDPALQFIPPQLLSQGIGNAPPNAPRGPASMRAVPSTQHVGSLVWRTASPEKTPGISPSRSQTSSGSGTYNAGYNAGYNVGNIHPSAPYSYDSHNMLDSATASQLSNIVSFTDNTPSQVFAPSSDNARSGASAIANAIKSGQYEAGAQFLSAPALNHRRQPTYNHSSLTPGGRFSNDKFDAVGNFVGRIPFETLPDQRVSLWIATGKPTLQMAWNNLPFCESANYLPNNYGVVRISDIPYNTTKNEVLSLVGQAPIVKMPRDGSTFAVHLIMERHTAKTMDCFIELETPGAAADLVNRLSYSPHRLGARYVGVTLSSQEALMRAMFPKAKCVQWDGQHPIIVENDDKYSSGFQFFVSNEELNFLVRHAQAPLRSHYAAKTPQRTYEAMISLLFKYPFHARATVTLRERDAIFTALRLQLTTLAERIIRNAFGTIDSTNLTINLLNELLDAGLKCPGFSEKQRGDLIHSTVGATRVMSFVTPMCRGWPFEVLGKQEKATEGLLKYFAALIAEASAPASLAERATLAAANNAVGLNAAALPFGNVFIDYGNDKEGLSLAAIAAIEWRALEMLLMKVLVNEMSG